ncbi:PTPRE-like protein, partial [Mya arenaria]
GYEKVNKFIASQGPMKNMIDEFWQMVWQQKSDKIVMLTNLIEMASIKCIQYWPEKGESCSYGGIDISYINTKEFNDYNIRTWEAVQPDSKPRRIRQFHFKAWPDKDVPDSAWCLVNFWKAVDTNNSAYGSPIVVHCSAGVGRTGTFIALDNLIHQANAEKSIRPLQMVQTLRRQRVNMVQTK